MASPRPLRNAPIKEALIDIRVTIPPKTDIASLVALHSKIRGEYPEKQERTSGGVQFEFREGKVLDSQILEGKPDGIICTSADRQQLVQFRLDGFTFNRLKPYISWDAMRQEAFRLWELYRAAIDPVAITRVALRYINRIEIPLPGIELKDYLTAPPLLPPNVPDAIVSFLTRVIIRDNARGADAIITQTGDTADKPNQTPVIVDIDVVSQKVFEKDGKRAWETIDQLRELKNQIFFESVTEKTLELCL